MDAPLLAKFRYAFRSHNKPATEEEAAFVERCRLWMQARLNARGAWRCWIAERADAPVGHVWIQLIEKIPNPSTESELLAYLTNFYVLENARGHGIGSMLLTAALEWCRDSRAQAVILWPTKRSRPLYLRYGFSLPADLLELIM
jgi:GNAT superfamily N-acetyltransferase